MQLAIYIYKTNERSKEMNGLSSSEVLRSREMHGSNKLPEPKMKKWYDFAKEALSEKNHNDFDCHCCSAVIPRIHGSDGTF